MSHSIVIMVAICLSVALLFGFVTQKMKLSPIVGYLFAGIVVGPFSPGFVADSQSASQLAEIGVILLMFGVGMQFHLKDLIAVKNVAIPGALAQIFMATLASIIVMHYLDYSFESGIIYGIAISVASTVVLMRVLTENHVLHTPIGHTAVGWLVVEDLFTILVLVLLPVIFSQSANVSISHTLCLMLFKLILLTLFVLVLGKKVFPLMLGFVARTGTRDLFTLAVLVLALGVAVAAYVFFDASMALGAFLAGMVIGQSDFSARAASEALPMRDAFAVLFFVSVGMLFNPTTIVTDWKIIIVTLFIIMIIKPISAIVVVLILKEPLKKALSVGAALAQIGEFSFILVSLGVSLGILNNHIYDAVIAASIISITLNPLIYKFSDNISKFAKLYKINKCSVIANSQADQSPEEGNIAILVGYGPIGRKVSSILLMNNTKVAVVEMNINTVKEISAKNKVDLFAVYGDASQRETLLYAGIESAQVLVISSVTAPASEIIEIARSINSRIRILIYTTYMRDAETLKSNGADIVFSGENEVAKSLSCFILKELKASADEIDWECKRIYDDDEMP